MEIRFLASHVHGDQFLAIHVYGDQFLGRHVYGDQISSKPCIWRSDF